MKKIWTRTLGIVLIILLLFLVNTFVGNPISNTLAKKAAQQYIDATYSELNLQIQKCTYNFKSSAYSVWVQSNTSEDTVFSIDVNSFGNVFHDNYKFEVANNHTTYRRLNSELWKIAQEMISGKLDYDFDSSFLRFVKDADHMKLTRDMKLDIHNPPFPLSVDVSLFSDNISYNKIAEVAKSLERILKEQNVPIDEYSVRLFPLAHKPKNKNHGVPGVNSLSLSSFPANRMSEKNLPKVMEQFKSG